MTDEESLRCAIHEEVSLQAWSAEWSAFFRVEHDRLTNLFPQIIAIEHIGSTAVESLAAKPIIDIMAGVASMSVAESLAVPLCDSGYTTSPEFNASLSDRKWFMRWASGHRTHHLHVVVHDGNIWHERLQFRNALRANTALAGEYSQLKQRLVSAHADDREAYTNAKSDFVREVLSSRAAL